jgi:hypothetical protein
MPDELDDQERRERLARVVEAGRAGPHEPSVGELARALLALFDETVEAVVLRLERSGGTVAQLDETTFGRRVRGGVGKVLAKVVAGFASTVLGVDVWDEQRWREVGEDPEAVRDATYGITDAAYGAIVHEHVEHLAAVWSSDLRQQVATVVSQAVLDGGVAEAKRRLRDEVGLSPERAQVIARTEVMAAWSHASWRTYLAERTRGDELRWDARLDERTRTSHRKAHGQRVAVGRPFVVGGHDARFPSDPGLPAAERVQCRCSLVLVDAGDEEVAVVAAAAGRAREREHRLRVAMDRLRPAAVQQEARAEIAALRSEVQAEAQRQGNYLASRCGFSQGPRVELVDLSNGDVARYRPAQDGEPEGILIDLATAVGEPANVRRALAHELVHALSCRTQRVGPGGALVASAGAEPAHGEDFVFAATRIARLLRLPEPTPVGAATWPPLRGK